MYIYTSVQSKADLDKNAYSIVYNAYSTVVVTDNSKGEVLFNSNLTDNYFKMIGFPTSAGGASTNELNTMIMIDSPKTIVIVFINYVTNTESPLNHSLYEPITNLFGSSTLIKIDYVHNNVIIDNQTGKEFDLKVTSYDADRQKEKTLVSDFVAIQKGKQTYDLNFKTNKSTNIFADKKHKNFMLISTESKGYENNDNFNVREVIYCGSGNFKDISKRDNVLFNTYANPNLYMKVEGLLTIEDIRASGRGEGGSVDIDKKYKEQILLVGIDRNGNSYATSRVHLLSYYKYLNKV